jgi:hypothetical protein
MSSRRSLPGLLAAAVTLVLLASPGVAAAEGPGYGGKADKLVLKRKDKQQGKGSDSAGELAVFGVGFRGGSKITLRIGSGEDKAAVADESGALRVLVNGSAHAGTTIVAVGQTPSGSAWTLVGSVPSEEAASGPQDFTSWIIAGLGALALAGGFAARLRRLLQGSKR